MTVLLLVLFNVLTATNKSLKAGIKNKYVVGLTTNDKTFLSSIIQKSVISNTSHTRARGQNASPYKVFNSKLFLLSSNYFF